MRSSERPAKRSRSRSKHPAVREQMVCERDRLSLLDMGVARQRRCRRPPSAKPISTRTNGDRNWIPTRSGRRASADTDGGRVRPGRCVTDPCAACPPPRRPAPQSPLNGGVHVLIGRLPPGTSRHSASASDRRRDPPAVRSLVVGRADADLPEHRDVRDASPRTSTPSSRRSDMSTVNRQRASAGPSANRPSGPKGHRSSCVGGVVGSLVRSQPHAYAPYRTGRSHVSASPRDYRLRTT